MAKKMDLSDYGMVLIFPEGEKEEIFREMQRCYIQYALAWGVSAWEQEKGGSFINEIFLAAAQEMNDKN